MTCSECAPQLILVKLGVHWVVASKDISDQDVANRTAVHHIQTKHRIDWEGATGIEFSIAETNSCLI